MADTVEQPIVVEDRKSTIAAAIAVADKLDGALEVPVVEKEQKEEKKETPIEEKKEGDLLAEQGKQLLLALQDPAKAPIVIKFLAEQAGYSKLPVPETKKEAKEIKNDILDELKEGLGEEFSIIAERLAPAIEKILAKKLEESQADIRADLQAQESEKLRDQSARAIEKLTTGFFGEGEDLPDNVNQEMGKYMDRTPPTSDMSPKDYLDDAFHYAIGKLGIAKPDKDKEAKISKNRTDAASRLSSERAPAERGIKQDNSKPMSRQDAIRAAVEAASKEN